MLNMVVKPKSEKRKRFSTEQHAPRQYEIELATKHIPRVEHSTPPTTLEQVKSIDVGSAYCL